MRVYDVLWCGLVNWGDFVGVYGNLAVGLMGFMGWMRWVRPRLEKPYILDSVEMGDGDCGSGEMFRWVHFDSQKFDFFRR